MSFADDPFQITAEQRLHFQIASEFSNALNDIVWMARPDGHIDYYNRIWFKYTGMTLEQAQAAGWNSVLHPNDAQHCMESWTNALKTGEPDKFELRLLRADGTYRWHIGEAIPVRNKDRQITKWLCICRDIDDQVQTQKVIQESYEKHKQRLLTRMFELEARNARMVSELTVANQSLEKELSKQEKLVAELRAVKQHEKVARYAAFHDPLTALPNRALFNDRLEHGIAQARRYNRILAVMFIDLDKFKHINDSFGHLVGDKVLIEAANRLMKVTRKDDTVCRQGGDEFLYLLFEIKSEADVAVIAEKINRALRGPCQIEADNGIVYPLILPSIGVAIFPKDGETADGLIKKADSAMYRAKRDQTGYAFAE